MTTEYMRVQGKEIPDLPKDWVITEELMDNPDINKYAVVEGELDAVTSKADSLVIGGHSRPVKIAVLGSPSGKSQIIIDSLSQMDGIEVEIHDFKVDESKLLSLKLEAPAYEARIDTWRPKNQRFGRVPQIGRHSGGRKTKRRK